MPMSHLRTISNKEYLDCVSIKSSNDWLKSCLWNLKMLRSKKKTMARRRYGRPAKFIFSVLWISIEGEVRISLSVLQGALINDQVLEFSGLKCHYRELVLADRVCPEKLEKRWPEIQRYWEIAILGPRVAIRWNPCDHFPAVASN
jgi:hypothetical protein